MNTLTASAALQLVHGELNEILNRLGDHLDVFAKNWQQRTGLDEAINDLLVVRGTLEMIDMHAARHFTEEALEVVKELPFQADANAHNTMAQVSYGCALLARYFDYIVSKQCDVPELLLPAINQLRQARREAPLLDSHFFPVRVPSVRIAGKVTFKELNQTGRRQHMLFQMGLLHVVKHGRKGSGLKLCARAVEVLGKSAPDGRHKEFWYLALGVVNAMNSELMLTPTRLRWLSQIERYMGRHIDAAREENISVIPNELWRDVFYHLSLSKKRPSGYEALAKAFHVQVRPLRDEDLLDAQRALGAPADQTYRVVLSHVRDELDMMLADLNHKIVSSPGAELDQNALEAQIHRLGQTLAVIEQATLAQELIAACAVLSRTELKVLVACHSSVQNVVNVLTKVRLGLDSKLSAAQLRSELDAPEPHVVKIDERKHNALVDVRSYLAETTAAFGAYIGSEGDRSQIRQVNRTMEKVCQALTFMKLEHLAEPLLEIQHVVDFALDPANLRSLPARTLTLVADLLMAVDYALECVMLSQPIPERVHTLTSATTRQLRKARNAA